MMAEDAIRAALSVPELAAEPYEPRGIINSEMALIIGLCREHGIETVIESGRARGQSTYLLAKYLPGAAIVSVERQRDADALYCENRVDGFHNVTLIYGNGLSLIPGLAEDAGGKIAVLLDGPKGFPALELLEMVKETVTIGFIHDMRKLDKGKPAPFRQAAEAWPGAFFTDADAFVEATRHFDAGIAESTANWKPHHIGGEYIGSYGPTLAVFPCSP